MTRPNILITNDDGIDAPGIKHLYNALKDYANITIVAPSQERSGSGLATTLVNPLHLHRANWENNTEAWQINGTPADCVKMALSIILEKEPDLIVSGINRGSNAGRNVLYSGTIGGVIEGVLRDVQGIAFSCEDLHDPDYAKTEKYIWPIVNHFLNNKLSKDSFLNVSFPSNEHKTFKGFKMAKQGKGYWRENPDTRVHPEGHTYCWLKGIWKDHEDEEKDSDVSLIKEGYIAVVPIQIHELTNHKMIEKHALEFENIFSKI